MNNLSSHPLSSFVAVILIAASSAFASTAMAADADSSSDRKPPVAVKKSRADVRAETRAALASHRLDENGFPVPAVAPTASAKSRADARAKSRAVLAKKGYDENGYPAVAAPAARGTARSDTTSKSP